MQSFAVLIGLYCKDFSVLIPILFLQPRDVPTPKFLPMLIYSKNMPMLLSTKKNKKMNMFLA